MLEQNPFLEAEEESPAPEHAGLEASDGAGPSSAPEQARVGELDAEGRTGTEHAEAPLPPPGPQSAASAGARGGR